MKLNISPEMKIGELKKKFNSMFPYLTLEIYQNQADVKLGKKMNASRSIGDVGKIGKGSSMEILPTLTVKQLESGFEELFSLSVQVFRKSGNAWLQTTVTDKWTLQHQNEHGREMSQAPKSSEDPAPGDYDLDRDASH